MAKSMGTQHCTLDTTQHLTHDTLCSTLNATLYSHYSTLDSQNSTLNTTLYFHYSIIQHSTLETQLSRLYIQLSKLNS